MKKIDARGRSCPQPVMMTRSLVEQGEGDIEVFLDNAVSASNVQRYLEKNGYRVRIIDDDGSIIIRGIMAEEDDEKQIREESLPPVQPPVRNVAPTEPPLEEELPLFPEPASAPVPQPAGSRPSKPEFHSGYAVLITRKTIGEENSLLGEVLMKGFLGTLSQINTVPSVMALMNEGVKLALKNTASMEHLAILEKKGVKILVCGTCTNHFGITSDIGAGVISNMFEISEALIASGKTISM